MAIKPNPADYPDLAEAIKSALRAQNTMVSMSYDDPSNFSGEEHKAAMPGRLQDALDVATREVERLCKQYGISYGDAMNAILS